MPHTIDDVLAFLAAAEKGDVVKLKAMIEAGIPIDAMGPGDETAIRLAARHGRVEAFRFLLNSGADPHQKDFRGSTLLNDAASGGKIEILQPEPVSRPETLRL